MQCCNNLYQENRFISKSTKRKRKDSSSDGDHANLPLLNRSHCYGPGCTQIARFNSKYCSDKCGTSLANARIFHVSSIKYIYLDKLYMNEIC